MEQNNSELVHSYCPVYFKSHKNNQNHPSLLKKRAQKFQGKCMIKGSTAQPKFYNHLAEKSKDLTKNLDNLQEIQNQEQQKKIDKIVEKHQKMHPPSQISQEDLEKNQQLVELIQKQDDHKKILVLCIGGTIQMFPSENGLIVKKGALPELIKKFPHMYDKEYSEKYGKGKEKGIQDWFITPKSIFNKRSYYQFYEIDKPIDSSNVNTQIYIQIAKLIEKFYNQYDAFVITHGTDTMCYTASMLSFILQNLNKTVILTGSMIPLSEEENDAHSNLACSLLLAGNLFIPEVCIFMSDRLVRGNRSKKSYSMGWDAFDSPMYPPLAIFNDKEDEYPLTIKYKLFINYNQKDQKKLPLKVHTYLNEEIAVIQINPVLNMKMVQMITSDPKIRGIIIETYGAGNIPSNNPELIKCLKNAIVRNAIVVNVSQCYHSDVTPIYETGQVLKDIGVVFGYDMTLETAICKLQYLLAKKHLKVEQMKILMRTPIRGEMSLPKQKLEYKKQNIEEQQKESEQKIQIKNRPYRLYQDLRPEEINSLQKLLTLEMDVKTEVIEEHSVYSEGNTPLIKQNNKENELNDV